VKRVSRRELRGAESIIADRESGIREVSDHDLTSTDFPIGKIPDKSKGNVGEFHRVSGIVRPESVS
jgi:hypothetical protein